MPTDGRSVTSVLQDIIGNIESIIRSEVRLAKLEIRDEAVKAKGAAMLLGIGALCGVFALLFLLWTAVFALGIVIPLWAAALVVVAITGIIAGSTLKVGLKRLHTVHPPVRTIETIKENAQWIKHEKQRVS